MAKDLIIVDSCVLIKAFRRDVNAINDLKEIEGYTAYSVITQLELLIGANTKAKKEALKNIFGLYYGVPLSQAISLKAVDLMTNYVNGHRIISVPDCLISATSINYRFSIVNLQ